MIDNTSSKVNNNDFKVGDYLWKIIYFAKLRHIEKKSIKKINKKSYTIGQKQYIAKKEINKDTIFSSKKLAIEYTINVLQCEMIELKLKLKTYRDEINSLKRLKT